MKLLLTLISLLCLNINSAQAGDVLFDIYIGGETNPCPGTNAKYGIGGDAANGFNIKINSDAGTIIAWTEANGTKHSNVSLQEISTYGATNYNGQLSVTIQWTNVRGTAGHLHVTSSNNGFGWNNNHGDRTYEIAVGSPDISGVANILASCDQASQGITMPVVLGATSYTWQNTLGWTLTGTYINGGYVTAYFTANTANTSGQVTVTVNNSGCPSTNSTKTYIVNRPAGNHFVDGPDNIPGGTYTTFNAPQGCTNYNWSMPNGWSIVEGQGTSMIKAQVINSDCPGDLYVTYTDLCGQNQTGTKHVNSTWQIGPVGPGNQDATASKTTADDVRSSKKATDTSAQELTFYPNPADDEVHINFSGSGKAVIYDAKGSIVRSIEFAPQSVANIINTMSLSNGVYHVCLFRDNQKILDKQLLIKH